jgi:hypothetical protein
MAVPHSSTAVPRELDAPNKRIALHFSAKTAFGNLPLTMAGVW